MRYNGGGSISVAEHIAGWIAGNTQSDKAFIKFIHNDKYSEIDTAISMPHNENSLDLDRVSLTIRNIRLQGFGPTPRA